MTTIVEETLLSVSASVKLLLQKLDSTEFADNFQSIKLDVSLLTKLKTTLESVLFLLNDDADFKEWLDMVSHAVFELHTLFDQLNTEALRRQVEAEYQTPTPTAFQVIKSKLLKLIERLELLSSGGAGGHKGKLVVSSFWHQTPESSVVADETCMYETLESSVVADDSCMYETPGSSIVADESSIYGRDSDINKLKNLLLSEDACDGDCKLRIICIVGMGGIGKTDIAKRLYNDPLVKEKFGVRGWAHVSKDFVVFRVLETILESITSKPIYSFNLNCHPKLNDTRDVNTSYPNLLLTTLQQILSRNLFLLVLDDVWDAKSVNWIYLMDIFSVGEMGSRVIITTRDERVALSMQTFLSIHYLQPLESEDCWSLFSRYAFGPCNNQQRSYLEEIGRKIAKKCDGLPLAPVKLGALFTPNCP